MRKRITVLLICSALLAHFSFAQQIVPCLADELYHEQLIKEPSLKVVEQQANERARNNMQFLKKAEGVKIIPVVFHIIHQNGLENIPQFQVMDQLRILNEDFRKKAGTNGGSSTDELAADMEIEFRLAQFDPAGNKHDGIVRVFSDQTVEADNNVKSLSYWDSNRYLNIWVVKSISNTFGTGTVLGYAQFPWQYTSSPATDGVMVRADYVGVVGTGSISGAGRTLTHEIGHWLGLYHTFQDACAGGNSGNCFNRGDWVCDTPPVASSSSGCPTNQNSCTSDVPDKPDQVKNYMDYADGDCANLFTSGQKARAYAMSFLGSTPVRGNMIKESNLHAAGLDSNGNYLPVGASTTFTPRTFDFEDGNPAAQGIVINNFNNPSNGWQINQSVGFTGSKSIYFRNFTNSSVPIRSRDGFQLPDLNMTLAANPWLTFHYAWVQKSSSTWDTLIVNITTDFGMTEYPLLRIGGNQMVTSDPSILATEFTPISAADWKQVSINLMSFKSFANARIRFELLNRRGNNMYIDGISISEGAMGVDDLKGNPFHFAVYPNPVNRMAIISYHLEKPMQVNLTVTDLLGRVRIRESVNSGDIGDHEWPLDMQNLEKGMYFVRLGSASASFSRMIFVN